MWIPVAMVYHVAPESPPGLPRGANFQYKIMARLKQGMTIEQAQAEGQAFHLQLVNDPPQNTGLGKNARFEVVSAATGYSPQRESFAQPIAILMIVVGAVLLIACANVANLLLARSAARQREIAMRLALGAGRARVVRQLLTESVLLAITGGVLGLLFSMWGTNFLAKLVSSSPVGSGTLLSIDLDLRPDGRMLAFNSGLCLLTAILFGLAPALRGSKLLLVPALVGRCADSAGLGSMLGLRKLLVISQVALSLVLLIGTGLFLRTLNNLKSEDLGFDRERLLLVWTQLGQTGRQPPELASLWGTMQERVSSLPGVLSASPSTSGFLTGDIISGPPLMVEGYTPKPDEDTSVLPKTIGPRFFETVGQQLLLGRDFAARDVETSPPVVIINESLARHFFGSDNPIGKHFRAGRSNSPLLEIVGVVTDAKYISPRENKDRMMFYYPYSQVIGRALSRMCLAVRTAGNSTAIAASVRQELRNIDPNLPVLKIDTVEEQLEDLLFRERLVTTIAGFFGGLAVLLACIGQYGVISYSVARRTNEIGIRIALGAMPTDVLRMVLKESMAIVLAGIALGIAAALATTRLMSAMLFGVSATDLATIAVATLLMIVVSGLAAFIPARRASRVDPMVALRYE